MAREAMIDLAVRGVLAALLPEDRQLLLRTFAGCPNLIAPMFVGDVRRAFREIWRERLVRRWRFGL